MSELLSRVNWVDVIALILLIKIGYTSSRIGVGRQILPLVLLVLIVTLTLHNYRDIARLLINRYSFSASLCGFIIYFIITGLFFIVYRIVSRITGAIMPAGDMETGGVEMAGGVIIGLARSVIIIGMLMIGLLLTPVKFLEEGVKNSYSGLFFINMNLRIYTSVINALFKLEVEHVSRDSELSQLLSEKEGYIFEWIDVKKKSKFLQEGQNDY